ncbi:MAG: alpha/beta hydrolase [Trueperaceae bacterium]|nr:alpha/beta hydrolase [Trueperaceae bacterium]
MPIRITITLVVFGILLLGLLVGPFLVPVPDLENTQDPQTLARDNTSFATLEGLSVHYRAVGAATDTDTSGLETPGFVLLHGFGSNLRSWRALYDPLSDYGSVIALDRPGFGLTEKPSDSQWSGTNPYSPMGQQEIVLELMDEVGLEQTILVGNSAGGTLALQLALNHPDRVRALVLLSPAAYAGGGTPGWARPLLFTPQLERVGPLIMRQFGSEQGLNLLRDSWANPDDITDQMIEDYQLTQRTDNWDEALWELTQASRAPNFNAERLSNITVPTLVLSGTDDPIVAPAQSERLAQALPNGQYRALADCGHLPHEECPDAVLDAVQQWLQNEGLVESETLQ